MALDFPQSPIDGQGYEGFEWDATAGVWRVVKQFVDPADIPQAIQFLCVAGGGSGGGYTGGGGGAGGLLSSVVGEETYASWDLVGYTDGGKTPTIPFTGSFTVTVGAGAAQGAANGSSSQIGDFVTWGGGRGSVGGGSTQRYPAPGGSGGGGGSTADRLAPREPLLGQGFWGGYSPGASGVYASGGGGGAGGRGGQPATTTTTDQSYGGVGKVSTITGSAVYYAGGGGAAHGGYPVLGGPGGLGGGGTGASQNSGGGTEVFATNGQTNTGGGGGGGYPTGGSGTATTLGGSGIVILRYPVSLPTLTTIGAGLTYSYGVGDNYRIYTFTAGTDTVTV